MIAYPLMRTVLSSTLAVDGTVTLVGRHRGFAPDSVGICGDLTLAPRMLLPKQECDEAWSRYGDGDDASDGGNSLVQPETRASSVEQVVMQSMERVEHLEVAVRRLLQVQRSKGRQGATVSIV